MRKSWMSACELEGVRGTCTCRMKDIRLFTPNLILTKMNVTKMNVTLKINFLLFPFICVLCQSKSWYQPHIIIFFIIIITALLKSPVLFVAVLSSKVV